MFERKLYEHIQESDGMAGKIKSDAIHIKNQQTNHSLKSLIKPFRKVYNSKVHKLIIRTS